MSRTLISIERRVENEQSSHYETAWAKFRESAVARGAKAWRFRSAGDESLYLEFLEFKAGADPRGAPEIQGCTATLDGIAAGRSTAWLDANIQ